MHEPLTTTQAATLLGCQAAHVRTLCDAGQLAGAQHDAHGRWQIPAAAITSYLAAWAGKGRPRGRGSASAPLPPTRDAPEPPFPGKAATEISGSLGSGSLQASQLFEQAARAEHLEFELSAARLDLASERVAAAEARAAHAEQLAAIAHATAAAAQEALMVLAERLKALTDLTQGLPRPPE